MMENKDLLKIADTFGAPVYVYDAEKIISQFQRLTTAFGSVKQLKLNYAAKALSNLAILKLMNSLGSGLDTVSIQEVKLGLLAGFGHSAWATISGRGDVWFDSITVLIAALLSARWLQVDKLEFTSFGRHNLAQNVLLATP